MIDDPKFKTAKDWFEKLRANLVDTIQNIDENKFEIIPWDHKSEGGGVMSKIKGNIMIFKIARAYSPRVRLLNLIAR